MCDVTPEVRTTFTKSLQAPALAREFVQQQVCPAHGRAASAAVELLASELVTNAVLYGRAPIILELTCSSDIVTVEVHDQTNQSEVFGASDGLGFVLVDKVANEWGSSLTAGGRTVWCRVRTDTVPRQRSTRQASAPVAAPRLG